MQVEDDTQVATEHDDTIAIPAEHEGDNPDDRSDDGDLARQIDDLLADELGTKDPDPADPDAEADPDATTEDPDAEGQGDEDDENEPSGDEGQAGAGGAPGSAGGDEVAPSSAPPVQPPITPAAPQMVTLPSGQVVPADDLENVLRWVNSLTADQVAALTQQPQATQPTAQPATPPAGQQQDPAAGGFNPEDFDDPNLAKYVADQLATVQAQQQALLEAQQRQQLAEAAAQQAEWEATLDPARETVKAELGIDDTQLRQLELITEQHELLPMLLQRTVQRGLPVDKKALIVQAMRLGASLDPAFGAQVLQARIDAEVQKRTAQQDETADKKARAAAAGGKAKSVSRKTPDQPLTPEQNEQALVAEIAALLNGNDTE